MDSAAFSSLRTGDIIKIVDSWDGVRGRYPASGEMDKWLGEVVTVFTNCDEYITIQEDEGDGPDYQGGHWNWYSDMVECVADDAPDEEIQPPSDDEIFSLLSIEGV